MLKISLKSGRRLNIKDEIQYMYTEQNRTEHILYFTQVQDIQ